MSEYGKSSYRRFMERYASGRHRKDSDPPAGLRAGAGAGARAGAGAGSCARAGSGTCTCLTCQPGYIPWGTGYTPPVPSAGGSPAALAIVGGAAQEGWDLVLDGGSRLPFPAASAGPGSPYPGAMQFRLVSGARGSGKSNFMHSAIQAMMAAPGCQCPLCQPPAGGPAVVSGSGYTSGGVAIGPSSKWQPSPLGCGICRQTPCRCPRQVQPARFSNKGMPGFDGHALPLPETGLGTEELPDVIGVLRGYRWWSMAAPDLSKSPARADEDWERSFLRGMRDIWQDGENIARCLVGDQKYHPDADIPHQDCSCGFWAYWTLQVHDIGYGQLPVCGVVEGYGATVIGERGFRAAKARIVALHLPFTIQPSGEPDDDPLGLGLPPRRPGSPAPGGPWWNHPQFSGRVHHMSGHDPDTGGYVDPSSRAARPAPELDRTSAADRQSNRDLAEAWLAVIGDRLSVMYPSAKVFETRAAMEAEFPPDLSYVPDGSREQCPHCSQWYQRRLNHPATCPERRS